MYENIRLLTHSSIRISGDQILYFDPFQVQEETHDADIIFITHEHFDHFSPEDIDKISCPGSVIVCPASMKEKMIGTGYASPDDGDEDGFIEYVEPGDELEINDVVIRAVPAYNIGRPFHPQENNWVGYLVTMQNTTYYIAGDTDITPENSAVKCDVALLPVGGTYTMTVEQAASLAEKLAPKLAVPTHYGQVAGDPQDGQRFADLLKDIVPVKVIKEY